MISINKNNDFNSTNLYKHFGMEIEKVEYIFPKDQLQTFSQVTVCKHLCAIPNFNSR